MTHGRGGKREARGARVGDDGHMVLRLELLNQRPQGFLHQRQLVGLAHRTRHIDQENEIGGRTVGGGQLTTLQADAHQPVRRLPGSCGHFERRGERVLVRWFGRSIVVGEIVDQFLNAHGIARRPLVVDQEAPHVGVAGGVDVDGEGGKRILCRAKEVVVGNVVIGLGVKQLTGPSRGGISCAGIDHGSTRHNGDDGA